MRMMSDIEGIWIVLQFMAFFLASWKLCDWIKVIIKGNSINDEEEGEP